MDVEIDLVITEPSQKNVFDAFSFLDEIKVEREKIDRRNQAATYDDLSGVDPENPSVIDQP